MTTQALTDHERRLERELGSLSAEVRAFFCIRVAARTVDLLEATALDRDVVEMFPVAELFRPAIEVLRGALGGGPDLHEVLVQTAAAIETGIPDEDAGGPTNLAVLTENAAASIVYAIRAYIDESVADAVWCARQPIEALDFLEHLSESTPRPLIDDPATPLLWAEVGKQLLDIQTLKSQHDLETRLASGQEPSSNEVLLAESGPLDVEWRARPGMRTRGTRLTSGETVSFSRGALDSALAQVRSGFVTMLLEHLPYMSPLGLWFDGEVVEEDDGNAELFLWGRPLKEGHAGDLALPAVASTESHVTDYPTQVSAILGIEPRNFSHDGFGQLRDSAPLPFKELALHANLPPLIFTLSLSASWAGGSFFGSFLKRLGDEAASGLVQWIRSAHQAAKESERTSLVSVEFQTVHGTRVTAVIPYEPQSAAAVDTLRSGLDELGSVAMFAGTVQEGSQPPGLRQATFIFDDGVWHLAWWATSEAVFKTDWYRKNAPDPSRVLGRPLFQPDLGGEGTSLSMGASDLGKSDDGDER